MKHVRRRRLELEAETAKGKKRRKRLKASGQVPGSAPRARPDRRERAAARHVGGGIDPTLYPASPSAPVPHMKSPVPPPATTIRGAGPPSAPAAMKQDDPTADAFSSMGAIEDMKDFANNKPAGNSGANDNTSHQRGGRVRRR